jgi:phosphoribosylformylglycinamidine synthase
MVGLIDDINAVVTASFKHHGDSIILLGETSGHVGGSEYLAEVHDVVSGDAPPIDLAAEQRLHNACRDMISRNLLHSAHDCSDGGLAVCIVESCIARGEHIVGAKVNWLELNGIRDDFFLFGEDQSRIVVSCSPQDEKRILSLARDYDVPARRIGIVGGETIDIGGRISLSVEAAAHAYERLQREMAQLT